MVYLGRYINGNKIRKYFKTISNKADNNKKILTELSYVFSNGLYVIKGDNGAGKTTLLYILGLLDEAYSGFYYLNNKDIKTLNKKSKQHVKDKISILFSKGNLLNYLSVKETRQLFCANKTNYFDLNLSLPEDQLVLTLSGGEEVLLALEIDLSLEKEIFLLDEVTAMLDDDHFNKVMETLTLISKRAIVILVSHDPRSYKYGKLLELGEGKLTELN